MRVAFLVYAFPMLSETFVREQIAGIAERGHEVTIYALHRDPDRALGPDDRLERLGLAGRVHYLSAPPGRLERATQAWRALVDAAERRTALLGSLNVLRFGRDALGLGLLHRAAALGRQGPQRFDVIHAQFGPLGHIAVRLRELGLWDGAIVTSFRGYDATRLLRERPRRYRAVFREAELLLPVSEALRRRLVDHGARPERTEVHHSGIDCAAFAFGERRLGPGEPLRLLSIARLVPKKGIDDAIRAVARLVCGGIDAVYEVIGDGPERASLERRVDALGLRGRVALLGARAHAEVRARLARAHLLLAPSVTAEDGDQEGIPNALKEAMACGLPVVATRHGGIPELVEDGRAGFLVAERDVAALAERLAWLARHPERWGEMGRAGRARIEAEYDTRRLNEALEDLYRRAMDVRTGEAREPAVGRTAAAPVHRGRASPHGRIAR